MTRRPALAFPTRLPPRLTDGLDLFPIPPFLCEVPIPFNLVYRRIRTSLRLFLGLAHGKRKLLTVNGSVGGLAILLVLGSKSYPMLLSSLQCLRFLD